MLKPQTQIEISAQAWECQACGGRDAKSCSCDSTAIMVALREAADKHAAHKESERQRARENRKRVQYAPVEKVKESGNGGVGESKPTDAEIEADDDNGAVENAGKEPEKSPRVRMPRGIRPSLERVGFFAAVDNALQAAKDARRGWGKWGKPDEEMIGRAEAAAKEWSEIASRLKVAQ